MPNWTRYASAITMVAAATGVFLAGQMVSHAEPSACLISQAGKTTTSPATRPAAATRPAKATATQPTGTRPAALATRPSPTKVIVYYFHRTLRCPTCRRIEELARQAVESGFGGELELGTVEWRPLDFQKRGNQHFEKEFKLESPSLVLVKVTNGRQIASQHLERTWELVGSPADFVKYVQDGLRGYLYGEDSPEGLRQ